MTNQKKNQITPNSATEQENNAENWEPENWETHEDQKAVVPVGKWVCLGILLVLTGIALVPALFPELLESGPPVTLTKPIVEPRTAENQPVVEPVPEPFRHDLALDMARPHIERAAIENRLAVDAAIKQLRAIFRDMRAGVPGFAAELNSLSGKWRLARYGIEDAWKTKVRKKESTRMHDRVLSRFRKHIISPDELDQRIHQIVEVLDYKIASSHNRMLAAIQADIMVARPGFVPPVIHTDELYSLLKEQCASRRARLLSISFGGEAAALVMSEVATFLVMRTITAVVASSAAKVGSSVAVGTATTGTATAIGGVATLGVGILVGIGVEMLISEISERRMVKQMNEMIMDMEQDVVAGNAGTEGVRAVLIQYVNDFNQSQSEGIRNAIWSLK